MPYEILDDEELEGLLRKVFRDNPLLRSQAALSRALSKELRGRDARASGERLRRLTLKRGLADLEIVYRHSERKLGNECPVCSSELHEMENNTLDGSTTVISRTCPECGFRIGASNREPGRYVFHARKRMDMDGEELERRTSLLREAVLRMQEGIELVERGTRMSPVSMRAQDDLIPRMRACIDSLETASIENLIRDLEYTAEEHPIWTRPLTSVKYTDRKD